MFSYVKDNIKPDMFVWTGDNSAHRVWENTQDEIEHYVVKITEEWNKVFANEPVSMFPIQGNHDTWPVNVENFDASGKHGPTILYDQIWKDFFTSEEALNTYRKWGYYSMPLVLKSGKKVNNAKVIGLNSQVSNNLNWHLFHSLTDPADHLSWLESELEELQKTGGSAIIISHIPPIGFMHSFGARYRSLCDRFQDVIRFSMFGHTHSEEYHITQSITSPKPIGFNFVAGSVTTYKGKNPGFTVLELDAEYLVPVKIDTYYYNITEANLKGSHDMWTHLHDWNVEY